jgi:plastocyanin
MKTKLLILICLLTLNVTAQTTHDLIWERFFISPNSDLTIEVGDTVRWTWTDPNHTVENVPGSSVETFDSGFFGPIGSQFSYTFTVVGLNDYFCGIHGAGNMSGTITVQNSLGIDDDKLNSFKILSNPANTYLNIQLAKPTSNLNISIYDLIGKKVLIPNFNNTDKLTIDINSLRSGLYLITLETDNSKTTKRFIKN